MPSLANTGGRAASTCRLLKMTGRASSGKALFWSKTAPPTRLGDRVAVQLKVSITAASRIDLVTINIGRQAIIEDTSQSID